MLWIDVTFCKMGLDVLQHLVREVSASFLKQKT